MAVVKPGLTEGNIATLTRALVGAPVTADSATLTDANFPMATGGVLCTGWKSVVIFARLTAAGATTWTLQTLVRAGVTASTADSWIAGAASSAVNSGVPIVVDVMGRMIFPRVDALTGAPTAVNIYVAGWEPLARR